MKFLSSVPLHEDQRERLAQIAPGIEILGGKQFVRSADQLSEALARFCKRNDIPLPMHPEKQLRCEDGNLTMQCRIDHRSRCKLAASV